jgi:hypothetical protein
MVDGTLAISCTWAGEPLDESERCTVDLTDGDTGWIIKVDAPFHRDPPPSAPPGGLDGLWAFEVVELFVAAAEANDAGADYTEIELSPHGHHLILRFAGVRRRVARIEPLAVSSRITRESRGERWHGEITLPHEALPSRPWRVNAFAMHGEGAARRYLAATPLPGPHPDFHQPSRFPVLRG